MVIEITIKDKKYSFKDSLSPQDAHKLGIPMAEEADDDQGAIMASFMRKFLRLLSLDKTVLWKDVKIAVITQCMGNEKIVAIFKDYMGSE